MCQAIRFFKEWASARVSIFSTSAGLEIALQNNDVSGASGIRTQIGRLDVAVDQILSFRAEFGAASTTLKWPKTLSGIMKNSK